MSHLTDIVSETAYDPVCFETLEPEDVIRIWNSAKVPHDGSRGRGRSRTNRGIISLLFVGRPTDSCCFQTGDDDNDHRGNDTKDLWDAEDSSAFDGKPFDFSQVAENSEKFRSELDNMKRGKHAMMEDPYKVEEIDMDSLINNKVEVAPKAPEPVKVEPVPEPRTTKIEFSSLLSSTTTEPFLAFNAPFSTASTAPTSSSLLSKIGVTLEPEAPKRPVEWFYRDPSNSTQGPFSQATMRQWNKDGYFPEDLPIQLGGWSKFHQFKEVFPDMKNAFNIVPSEPLPILPGLGSLSLGAPAPVVPAAKPVAAAPVVAAPEPVPTPVVATKSAVAAEAPKAAQSSKATPAESASQQNKIVADVDRSNIAKKFLGLSQAEAPAPKVEVPQDEPRQQKKSEGRKNQRAEKEQHQAASKAAESAPASQHSQPTDAKPKGWNKDGEQKPKAPSSTNLLEIQNEQRVAGSQSPKPVEVATSSSSAAPSTASIQLKSFLGINASKALGMNNGPKGWSNVAAPEAAVASTSSKSLQEIMSEEMSQKKTVEEVVAPVVRSQPNSWASKAAKSSGLNPTVHTTVPTVLARGAIPPAPSVTVPSRTSSASAEALTPPAAPARSTSAQAASRGPAKSDFGGKGMSREMAEWCSAQLRRLNASEDAMGVLDYCLSIKSSVDIRETLSTYFGSSPQVSFLASQFVLDIVYAFNTAVSSVPGHQLRLGIHPLQRRRQATDVGYRGIKRCRCEARLRSVEQQ